MIPEVPIVRSREELKKIVLERIERRYQANETEIQELDRRLRVLRKEYQELWWKYKSVNHTHSDEGRKHANRQDPRDYDAYRLLQDCATTTPDGIDRYERALREVRKSERLPDDIIEKRINRDRMLHEQMQRFNSRTMDRQTYTDLTRFARKKSASGHTPCTGHSHIEKWDNNLEKTTNVGDKNISEILTEEKAARIDPKDYESFNEYQLWDYLEKMKLAERFGGE